MKPRVLLGIAILCLGFTPLAKGFFQDEALGVRPAGLGDAFVAVADDANTLLHNPAGLTRLQGIELIGMYSDLFGNLNSVLFDGQKDRIGYNLLAFGLPLSPEAGSLGVAWSMLDTALYKEQTYLLAYGRKLGEPLSLGVSLKGLQWSSASTVYQDAMARSGWSVDAGLLLVLFPGFTLGVGGDQLLPVDLGADGKELVPMVLRTGLAYRWDLQGLDLDSLLATVEFEHRNVEYASGAMNYKMGTEAWFWKQAFGLRMGLNRDQLAFGLSAAIKGDPLTFELDYAFSYPLNLAETLGSHRLGMTLRWGSAPARASESTPSALPSAQPEPVRATPVPTPASAVPETPAYVLPPATAEEAALLAQASVPKPSEFEQQLQRVQDRIDLGEIKPIAFEKGVSKLKKTATAGLDAFGKVLESHPAMKVRVTAYAALGPTVKQPQKLAQVRAGVVKDYLVKRFELSSEMIESEGRAIGTSAATSKSTKSGSNQPRIEIHAIAP